MLSYMRRDFKILSIWIVMLMLLILYSPIQQSSNGRGFSSPSMNDIFGNASNVKSKWWEVFNQTPHIHKDMEQEWHNWTAKWQKKFNKTSEEFKAKWKEANTAFRRMMKIHALLGGFSYENGYGVGNFVKFMFNDTDIVDYTVIRDENITVFNFVHVENFHPIDGPVVNGAVWRVNGENASIEIHDNPVALLKIKTVPRTITFYPSEGMNVELDNNSAYITGAINGTIILAGEGGIELSNGSVKVRVESSKGCVLFLAEPEINNSVCVHRHCERVITKHIVKGKIFARVLVNDTNSSDGMVFINGSINCLTFKHRVRVEVNGSGEGKSVVIDISNRVLRINDTNRLKVFVDGKEINIGNYTDVLNETGIMPKYAIINGSNGIIVIVYLPHFSIHTIDIYAESYENRSTIPGFEAVFVVLSIIVAVILKRKKNY